MTDSQVDRSDAFKPGDFGCVPMRGHARFLVRLGQYFNGDGFADFEHAFIYVGNDQVVEARPGGATTRPLDDFDGRRIAWYHCPGSAAQTIVNAALGLQGTEYSALDYFALVALRLHVNALYRGIRNRVTSSKHMICSQLVDFCYQIAGVHLFSDGRDPGDVTPGDLYKLIVAQESQESAA